MTSRKKIQWTLALFMFTKLVKTLALILMIYRMRIFHLGNFSVKTVQPFNKNYERQHKNHERNQETSAFVLYQLVKSSR